MFRQIVILLGLIATISCNHHNLAFLADEPQLKTPSIPEIIACVKAAAKDVPTVISTVK